MTHPQPLTRAELAQFLPTDRAIRAFEALFRNASPISPDELVILLQEISLAAGSSDARAQQALDQLDRLTTVLELAALAPPAAPVTVNELADVTAVSPSYDWMLRFNPSTNQWEAVNDHSVLSLSGSAALTKAAYTARVTTSGITVTLPAASEALIGIEWTVLLGVEGVTTIAPNGSDSIILPTTDTTISLYQKGDSVTLRCLDATTWGLV